MAINLQTKIGQVQRGLEIPAPLRHDFSNLAAAAKSQRPASRRAIIQGLHCIESSFGIADGARRLDRKHDTRRSS